MLEFMKKKCLHFLSSSSSEFTWKDYFLYSIKFETLVYTKIFIKLITLKVTTNNHLRSVTRCPIPLIPATKFPCEMRTPFGLPDVPEVYMMIAKSSFVGANFSRPCTASLDGFPKSISCCWLIVVSKVLTLKLLSKI